MIVFKAPNLSPSQSLLSISLFLQCIHCELLWIKAAAEYRKASWCLSECSDQHKIKALSLVTVERERERVTEYDLQDRLSNFFVSLVSCIDRHKEMLFWPIPSLFHREVRGQGQVLNSVHWAGRNFMVSLLIMELGETHNFSSSEGDALWWPSAQASLQRGSREKTIIFH